jgi:hypothetical protein
MNNIVYLGYGVTSNVDKLMRLIKENPEEFGVVGRLHDGDRNYSFIALFKDKCVVGKLNAVLEEWGTNDGVSGEGGSGFERMNRFIKENGIDVMDITLDTNDAKKIGYTTSSRFSYLSEWEDRAKIWQKYIEMLSGYYRDIL